MTSTGIEIGPVLYLSPANRSVSGQLGGTRDLIRE